MNMADSVVKLYRNEFKISPPYDLTKQDVEDIIVGSFEGGCNYWIDSIGNKIVGNEIIWEGKEKGLPTSIFISNTLLQGGSIYIKNEDEDEVFILSLDALIKGIKKVYKHGTQDIDQYDAMSYDCIIQYAIYDEVVYG
jgi:hypothetical protein